MSRIKRDKAGISSESLSGILLVVCIVASLGIANSSWGLLFGKWLGTNIGLEWGWLHLDYSLQVWINDGLMAVFFFSVGLEIKRECVNGELSSFQHAISPVLCAVGGAVTPALIYFVFNNGLQSEAGWGIPMATDIAFALAVIGALGKRVPPALKIFLAALAIADDLMAILVIVFFYSGELHLDYLLLAAAAIVPLIILNRMKVTRLWMYIIPGILLWYFIHHSGIHATIAGVITALFVPSVRSNPRSPLERMEHALKTPVNFFIVPLFALANISFDENMVPGLTTPLGMGILLGLVIGKPMGILLAALIGVRTGICRLPAHTNWRQLAGAGMLAGIGFTMSIFLSILSFTDPTMISQAKFSVLCASLLSALLGVAVVGKAASGERRASSFF